jgi:hemerythrin-like domain-containing protein
MPASGAGEEAMSRDVGDPLLAHLDELTRAGTVVAAFAAAHASFRRYHQECLELASSAATDGRALDALRRTVAAYVTLFHEHHDAEERYLFPTLRRIDRGFDAVVDQLLEQHEALADRVAAVASSASALETSRARDDLPTLVADLVALDGLIADHLAFEEAATIPEISTWTSWPSDPDRP